MAISKEELNTLGKVNVPIHIIACGDTGKHWDGSGPSIGVNDCEKWGHKVDYLILLNSPGQFQASRLETIKASKPHKVYTNMPSQWSAYFDQVNLIAPLRRWGKGEPIRNGVYYHSNTSPFVALSMAYSWQFKQIVLWGVDLVTHHRYGKDGSGHVQEMMKFQSYFHALKSHGVEVFIGAKGTAFDNILPVWEKEKSLPS
jgi:hypothetical protein